MRRNYNDEEYSRFRKQVLNRDNRKCQMPGCGSSFRLNVHHIRKWSIAASLRYETSNGITLCSKCHKSITGKEHFYENIFREIIDGKI